MDLAARPAWPHREPDREWEKVLPLTRSPIVLFDAVLAELERARHLAPASFETMAGHIRRFGRFSEAVGCPRVEEIDLDVAERWVFADKEDGVRPALGTLHIRRSAIRLLYRRGRSMGLLTGDPSQDLDLPTRPGGRARPLEDDEVALGREWALDLQRHGYRAAAWALAEAGAHQAEIAAVRVEDVDVDRGIVRFRGGRGARPRSARLTPWGQEQITSHLERTGEPTTGPLLPLTHPRETGRASAVGMALHGVLREARLLSEDVCARSIVAWAGVQMFRETGQIEEVARRLGMRSLDAAATLIRFDWREGLA